jgi:hypothetical protein
MKIVLYKSKKTLVNINTILNNILNTIFSMHTSMHTLRLNKHCISRASVQYTVGNLPF